MTLSSDSIFEGKVIKVTLDKAKLPSGNESTREVVRHPGAAAVVVVNEKKEILLEHQYRYALDEVILEIPAGKLDPEESPLSCARRELEEETGIKAMEWISLGSIVTSPGFCDETIYIYLARQLSQGEKSWDEDEYVELEYFSLEQLDELMIRGRLKDAKTLAALQLAKIHLQEN